MALFRRKDEVVEEVPELERYYAERQTSSAWSWLMALVTMILTILIIIGLFFAGRWVYRELIADEKSAQPTVNAPVATSTESSTQATTGGTTSLPAGEGTTGQPNGGTAPVTSSTNATAGSSASTTSASSNALPDSGPGTTIAITAVIAATAYFLRLYQLSRKRV